jgi:hypothetical protein
MAGAVAVASLVGTSAFAESRHSDATGDHHGRERVERSNDSSDHGSSRSNRSGDSNRQADSYRNNGGNRSENNTYRNNNGGYTQPDNSRNNRGSGSAETYRNNRGSAESYRNNRGYAPAETYRNNRSSESYRNNRGAESYRNNRGSETYRNNRGYSSESYRNGGNDRSRGGYRNNRPSYDNRGRHSYSIGGRISRFLHETGGYRIWVDGGRYPVWIPEARIHLFPHLRVGLSLNFGGYYDPLGYVEAYDYYNDGYGYGGAYSTGGLLRGVVETVDYRRGTLVLRDETSGSFVTAVIRDRRLESLRPGDYAEISGDWTRAGVFEAIRLENVDGGRY